MPLGGGQPTNSGDLPAVCPQDCHEAAARTAGKTIIISSNCQRYKSITRIDRRWPFGEQKFSGLAARYCQLRDIKCEGYDAIAT